tara:strand:+ start:1670 stop:2722 length:1053 start_codon:yes stop_codon:yes gene_type:complete
MAIPSDQNTPIDMKRVVLELQGTPYSSAVGSNLEELDWMSAVNAWTSNSNSTVQPTDKYSLQDWRGYDHFAVSSFVNDKAVSKTTATSATHSINFVDTDDTFNFTGGTEWTISFWIKAGWSSSLNTNIHFIIGQKQNASYQLSDMIKILYHENTNRIEARYGNKTTSSDTWYKMGQWLFHSNSGAYAAGYQAAGLGSTYWSASNRGYANSDGYTMITITKSTTNSAAAMKLYWNANAAGAAPLQTNSGSGSPAMSSTNNRSWSLGSNGVSNGEIKCGNSSATLYNDLSIFQKELSASEVTELYNSGTAMDVTTHSAANKLKGYWKWEGNGNATTSNDDFSINGQSEIVNK